jgi:hypothetical protein
VELYRQPAIVRKLTSSVDLPVLKKIGKFIYRQQVLKGNKSWNLCEWTTCHRKKIMQGPKQYNRVNERRYEIDRGTRNKRKENE